MELTTEMQLALASFAAVMAANALRWLWRRLTDYVRGTPNKIDDKIVAAMNDVVGSALRNMPDFTALEEREAELDDREDDMVNSIASREADLDDRKDALNEREHVQAMIKISEARDAALYPSPHSPPPPNSPDGGRP